MWGKFSGCLLVIFVADNIDNADKSMFCLDLVFVDTGEALDCCQVGEREYGTRFNEAGIVAGRAFEYLEVFDKQLCVYNADL